jgi:hypothetical protein
MFYPQDEEQTLTSASKLSLHFYATFLTCYFCDNDLSNAKYLWKRAPANLKVPSSGAMLAEMWEVGKLLWKDDLAAALAQLTSVNWPEELRSVVLGLRDSIVSRHLAAVAQAYDQIPTATVAQQLGLTTQYVIDSKFSQSMVSCSIPLTNCICNVIRRDSLGVAARHCERYCTTHSQRCPTSTTTHLGRCRRGYRKLAFCLRTGLFLRICASLTVGALLLQRVTRIAAHLVQQPITVEIKK